ncbi:MAG TPA: hypothetical protein EYH25_00550 [Thermotoga sp.]|nr:hypothetical protein [Thermotoga sp.]
MKKKILSFMVLAIVSSAMIFAFFPDVPKHHWAYEYVYRLWERGIFIGYPDKTFKGDRYITRYEAATAVSRLLDFIEKKVVGAKIEDLVTIVNGIALRTGELTRDVMKLKTFLEDLKAKLENLESVVNEQSEKSLGIEKEIESLKKKISEMELNLSGTISSLLDVAEKTTEVDNLKEKLANLEQSSKEIMVKLNSVEESLEKKADLSFVKEVVENVVKALKELKQTVLIHDRDILKLYENSAVLERDIITIKNEIKKVESDFEVKLEDVSNRLDEVNKKVDALTNSVDDIGNKIVELTFKFKNKDAELEGMIKKVASVSTAKDEELEKKIEYLEDYLSRDFTKKIVSLEKKMNTSDKMLWTKIEGVKEEVLKVSKALEEAKKEFEAKILEVESVFDDKVAFMFDEIDRLTQETLDLQDGLMSTREDLREEMDTMKKELSDEISKAEARAKEEAMKWGVFSLIVGVAGILIAIFGK